MIVAAEKLCTRINELRGAITPSDLTALVAACTAASSCPDVALDLCSTVAGFCHPIQSRSSDVNRARARAAGVIHAVVAGMRLHGAAHAHMGGRGTMALRWLACDCKANGDAIVLSAGGLDAILAVMEAHPDDSDVQFASCSVLYDLAEGVGHEAKRVMRESNAKRLIRRAKRIHGGNGDLARHAMRALASLKD